MADILYLVIPCYNEETVLPETSRRLREKMQTLIAARRIAPESRILLVDDGSADRTWELITALHKADALFDGVRLSRNRGHQNALLAGLMTARRYADLTISMDADLQDDPEAVDAMLTEYEAGAEVVYGVRSSRETDRFFKRFTAEGFYKLLAAMGAEVVYNHADYRLLSRRALEALAEYGESNLFLRGIVPMLGFRSAKVEYARAERFAGESKYPLKKMLALAEDGITSLSAKPLRLILYAGLGTLALAFVLLIVFLIGLAMGRTMLNWKIVLFALLLLGGLILLSLGILGEYIGKLYLESKHRPRYFIAEELHGYRR